MSDFAEKTLSLQCRRWGLLRTQDADDELHRVIAAASLDAASLLSWRSRLSLALGHVGHVQAREWPPPVFSVLTGHTFRIRRK